MRRGQPRQHSEAHLQFVRGLPCAICHNNIETEAAHVRFGELSRGKPRAGIGEKPDDKWAVPLCGKHHRQQHTMSEREWWRKRMIDPITLAERLWACAGDHAAGLEVIATARSSQAPDH